MDELAFERAAERDGFTLARSEMVPGRETHQHDHAFDIRGLVLEGRFTVDVGGSATVYGPGEVFEVPAGVAHAERHDPQGGRLLVGRRQADG